MAGIFDGVSWVAHPTEKVLARWDRMNPPRLGDWTESQPEGLAGLPRPPAARYPETVRLNTLYWPTHLGGFAFGWFLVTGSGVFGQRPTWLHPALQKPTFHLLEFYAEPTVDPILGPVVGPNDGVKAGVWALAAYALSVLEDGQESLWAVPVVDDRFFHKFDMRDGLQTTATERRANRRYARLKGVVSDQSFVYNPQAGIAGLGHPSLAFPPTEAAGDEFDDRFTLDLGPLTRARGSVGDVADCGFGMMGMRGVWAPPNLSGLPSNQGRGQTFARAAYDLDAWLEDPRVSSRLRDGVGPGFGPPVTIPGNVQVSMAGNHSVEFQTASQLLAGVTTSSHTVLLDLPVRFLRDDNSNVEAPYARETARRLAAALLAWTTRPFMLVTAGCVAGCKSALVGMWEFSNGRTVAHGLTWDTWWAGGPQPLPDAGVIANSHLGPATWNATQTGIESLRLDDNTPVWSEPYHFGEFRGGIEYLGVKLGGVRTSGTVDPASYEEYPEPPVAGASTAFPRYQLLGEAHLAGMGLVNELSWQQFNIKGFPYGVGVGATTGPAGLPPYPASHRLNAVIMRGFPASSGTSQEPILAGAVLFSHPNTAVAGSEYTAAVGAKSFLCGTSIPTNLSPTGATPWNGGLGFGISTKTNPSTGIPVGVMGQHTGGSGPTAEVAVGTKAASFMLSGTPLGGYTPPGAFGPVVSGYASAGYMASSGGFQVPLRLDPTGVNAWTDGEGDAENNAWVYGKSACIPGQAVGPGTGFGSFPASNGALMFQDGLYVGGGGIISDLVSDVDSLSTRMSAIEGYFTGAKLKTAHGGTELNTVLTGQVMYGNGIGPVATAVNLQLVSAVPYIQDPITTDWVSMGTTSV